MNRIVIALALAALGTSASAQTAAVRCVAREDAAATFVALMPAALDAASERCKPFLPANAFLTTGAGALAKRYRAEAGHPTKSFAALMTAITGSDLPPGVSADTMLTLMSEMLKPEVAKLKAANCADVNDIVEALAPLPAANLQKLLGAIGALTLTDKQGKKQSLTICPR